ncbi:acetyl-CoA carboxylase biotin carboxyl carrier protein [Lactococcus fujiensis]|uniref:Biotin carboxyl carrier protein of acetyl-CoA carboxylase n=1 Tax=Lactococcus fujiensis JCM 16395 TaxID=1291764 RepID=A0A2A5RPU1_9LACT|nr:acetyl-CoA carboxylase biotin carboxyl carrier protein [Lactococcus fujiensis]PCS01457.1 acetyl-CoA carboxylase biotin carboxyl carrier protein subunit [Lactococcus fujiensis JCM 16395]
MNISEVKELMDKFDGSTMREFSWKNAEGELALSKNDGHTGLAPEPAFVQTVQTAPAVAATTQTSTETTKGAESAPQTAVEGDAVESPLVGVVYLKAGPDKPEFVQVGDTVKKGQTLLIIEAMKVMNEIPAPKDGVITDIMVSPEEVVEYGQGLVRIK